jgi:hypothetical protein
MEGKNEQGRILKNRLISTVYEKLYEVSFKNILLTVR